ncbi:MAG: lipopolysaccharide kinase InaA family protein [Planctomycetota bacterium]
MLQNIAEGCPESILTPLMSRDLPELETWLSAGLEIKRNRVRVVRRMPTGILKEFLGRGAETRAAREFHNLEEVVRLGLPAPRPLWVDKIYGRILLLMEDQGVHPTLADHLQLGRPHPDFLETLGRLVQSMAQAGAHHRDLQAGNILVIHGAFSVVDWGAAVIRPGPLVDHEILDMALGLLSSLEKLSLREQMIWLKPALRGLCRRKEAVRDLFLRRQLRWERHFRSRARKALENSSSWVRLDVEGLAMARKDLDSALVKAALTTVPKAPFLKDDIRRRVWIEECAGQKTVAKEFLDTGIWRRLAGRSPSRRSWLAQTDLTARGLNVPAPLAYWERPNGTGIILMEYGMGQGLDKLLHGSWKSLRVAERRQVEAHVASLLQALCRRRCLPGDLKACNILVADDRAQLVDLDGVRRGREITEEDMATALVQLNTSIPRAVSWRARARLLLGAGIRGAAARRVWALVRQRSAGKPVVYQGVSGDVHEAPL